MALPFDGEHPTMTHVCKPHEFVEVPGLPAHWRCRLCNLRVDGTMRRWYEIGLEHGGARRGDPFHIVNAYKTDLPPAATDRADLKSALALQLACQLDE